MKERLKISSVKMKEKGVSFEATLRLFRALPITTMKERKINKELLNETIKRGFIFSPDVVFNYSDLELEQLVKTVERFVGLTASKMNESFHKSWKKVKDAPIEQLIFEQIVHYITTYGFETLGIYDENSVYIPHEKLEIPELKENVKLTLIKGYTKDELKEKVLKLLQSGIALKEETIKDVVEILKYTGITDKEVNEVKNKEVRIALYDLLGMFPENPIEFLRYTIYKLTGKTLLIKNKVTIESIKTSFVEDKSAIVISKLLTEYEKKYGLERLAEIFYRFKPLFLALKSNKVASSKINKIRKLAKKCHVPMHEDYLNSITAMIGRGDLISKKQLKLKLTEANTFRKIRLAYALKFRMKDDVDSIVYKIRNGKGWAADFNFEEKEKVRDIFDIVLESISNSIRKNIEGKKIYIPKDIVYTLPATEKQFTENIPIGSYVTIPKDMIVGVHWENVEGERIDLDLSMINESRKMGWDSSYRNYESTLLFSGDITAAPLPNGASELYYVQRQVKDINLLFVNNYTFHDYWNGSANEVPFKIFVGKGERKDINRNYMFDPNNLIMVINSKIGEKQKMLGMLVTTTKECRFYFVENYIGGSITSRKNTIIENSRKFLFNFYTNTLSLNDILLKAGAELLESKEECDIDLSPENLERDTIINLITR